MTDSAASDYQARPSNIPGVFAWSHGGPSQIPRPFRVAPYWYAGIVVRRVWSAQRTVNNVSVEIHGPAQEAFVYAPEERVEQLGLAIAPELTRQLLAMRCDDIPNHNLGDVGAELKKELEPLAELAFTGAGAAEIMDSVSVFVAEKLRDNDASLDPFAQMVRNVRIAENDRSVRHVAAMLDLSERQFRRKSIEILGCTPKRYLRGLRLQRALDDMDACATVNWSSLAFTHGFSDQSHLIREFRALMKTSPSQTFMERKLGLSDLSNTGTQIFRR